MKVGLTYDLRSDYLRAGYSEEETAEFDRPDTIEGIEGALNELGFETERIGRLSSLMEALTAGRRWDAVFNIAEGLYGFGREAQVPAILEAYQIPCTFSDSMILAVTLHKGMTKHIIRDQGLRTPDFAVVSELREVERVDLPCPLFVKPVAEGTSKGITGASLVTSRDQLPEVVNTLLTRFRQPVLIERFLPGREFTVGITGTGDKASAIGTMEVHLTEHAEKGVYSFSNKEDYEDRVTYSLLSGSLAMECEALALGVWRGLGCRDAGRVDLRIDDEGKPSFMEINPLAGLNPVRSDICILAGLAGVTYQELIGRIMESLLERCGLPRPAAFTKAA